jgi:hypothetical protein
MWHIRMQDACAITLGRSAMADGSCARDTRAHDRLTLVPRSAATEPPRDEGVVVARRRGRPTLVSDRSWLPLCHVMLAEKHRFPTQSYAAIARAHGVAPRTFQSWRRIYEYLSRVEPRLLAREIGGLT